MNYKDLKLDRAGVMPTFDAIQPLLLQIIDDETNGNPEQDCQLLKIKWILYQWIDLPDDLLAKRTNSGQKLADERVTWGLHYLHELGYVNHPKHPQGHYSITQQGLKFLDKYSTYKQQAKVLEGLRSKVGKNSKVHAKSKPQKPVKTHSINVSQRIYNEIHQYNERIKHLLIMKVRRKDPSFFEHLVVQLLSKMGYKGPDGKAIVTQQTRDGGVDGLINQDPLGTNMVCVQAKRYEASHKVNVHDIRDFFASLKDNRYSQGIFITTSDFTDSAVRQAHRFSMVIVNGKELGHFMLKYGVGSYVKHHYNIYGIDKGFFDQSSAR